MTLGPDLQAVLRERLRYCREMGLGPLYRRDRNSISESNLGLRDSLHNSEETVVATAAQSKSDSDVVKVSGLLDVETGQLHNAATRDHLLRQIANDIGPDCQRCNLGKLGRKQIVFGTGNPHAELMFIGEGPGADEDQQGLPFVGRAGQLLNNMITAMGLQREQVYIANIVKCRPPGNRTPERDECDTCSPFLLRQIGVIRPKVIVALGATAAKNLLGLNDSMASLRGRFYEFSPPGVTTESGDPFLCKLAVTYHPAFLLRDPRQKKEAWKDLQMVMRELLLVAPQRPTADQ